MLSGALIQPRLRIIEGETLTYSFNLNHVQGEILYFMQL
jgi:hypothetical protein